MTRYRLNFEDEEVLNTLTHGVGALCSAIALLLMVTYSVLNGGAVEIISSVIFGLSLFSLYSASTIYHAVRDPDRKRFYQRVDHIFIFVLIAGTYTPVMLVGLKGIWGWTIFWLVWGLAFLGFIYKMAFFKKYPRVSLAIYLLMGWLAMLIIKPLMEAISFEALLYLILGGLAYTVGAYFFYKDHIKYNHAIWHLFVMAGSALHFFGIFFHILP